MKRQFDADELVACCKERTGDNLKGVCTYNTYGNIKFHYLRSDIEDNYDTETLEDILRKAVSVEDAVRHMNDEEGLIGSAKASLHTFDNSVIVQLMGHNPERGALAIFDTDVASRHMEFLQSLEERALNDAED